MRGWVGNKVRHSLAVTAALSVSMVLAPLGASAYGDTATPLSSDGCSGSTCITVNGNGLTVSISGHIASPKYSYTGEYVLYDSDGYFYVAGRYGFGPPTVNSGALTLPNQDRVCNKGSNGQTACETVHS